MNKKPILIKWKDASGLTFAGHNEWSDLEEAKEKAEERYKEFVETIGWKIFENKDYVVMAATRTGELYSDLSMIPKCLIIT